MAYVVIYSMLRGLDAPTPQPEGPSIAIDEGAQSLSEIAPAAGTPSKEDAAAAGVDAEDGN